jgi:hypothetical protein
VKHPSKQTSTSDNRPMTSGRKWDETKGGLEILGVANFALFLPPIMTSASFHSPPSFFYRPELVLEPTHLWSCFIYPSRLIGPCLRWDWCGHHRRALHAPARPLQGQAPGLEFCSRAFSGCRTHNMAWDSRYQTRGWMEGIIPGCRSEHRRERQ